MKHLIYGLLLFSVWACSGQSTESTTAEVKAAPPVVAETPKEPEQTIVIPEIPADYVRTKLTKVGLNASFMTPKDPEMQESELSDNQGTRPYHIFLPFRVPTGNADRDKDYGGAAATIEVLTTEWDLKKYKEYIEHSSISGWQRLVQQESDYIIYSVRPQNTNRQPLRANDKEVFHFLMVTTNEKDGRHYCLRSGGSTDLTLDEMLRLLAIAKSVEWL